MSLRLPEMTTIRTTWRSGMSTLEQNFMELLSKLNMEFEAKCLEFDRMRDMLNANHAFLS